MEVENMYSGLRLYQYNEDDLSVSGFLTSFFQISSLPVNKEKLLIDSFYLIPCLCV